MQLVEETSYWSMTHNEQTRSIELDWKATTDAMSADDFKQALEHLARHVGDQTATGVLIDVRRSRFAMTPELDRWRLQNIGPAYNVGGLKRFPDLLPPSVGFRPGGGDAATFVTDYSDDPDRARAWLREG